MSLPVKLLRRLSPSAWRQGENFHTLAFRLGQWRSIRAGLPLAADGTPLPWYTYPAIEYLSQFDFSACRVFEFGAGNSSLYWGRRALEVVTVENDPEWADRVRAELRAGQSLLLRERRDEYVGALEEQRGAFDVIAIDGRWRQACASISAGKMRDGGFILLDNSDKFPEAADALRRQGLFEVDFSGFGPVNNYPWTTSMFLRAEVTLQRGFRNPQPVGGLGAAADRDREA
jgi:hypothetical protein